MPREMNREYAFYTKLQCIERGTQLHISCSNLFQVYLNGKLFYAGTMRSAHGYSFLVKLELPETPDELHILVLLEYLSGISVEFYLQRIPCLDGCDEDAVVVDVLTLEPDSIRISQ